MTQGGNAAACLNKLSLQEAMGKFQMLKFYFNGSPNPTKVAFFLEEMASPTADRRRHPQGRTVHAGIPRQSIRTIRCPPSTTTASPCSTATPSCSTSPKRPASSCPPHAGEPRGIAVVADVRRDRRRPFSGQAVHFKHFAPEKIDYAPNRYQFEAQRHYAILNDHLAMARQAGNVSAKAPLRRGGASFSSPEHRARWPTARVAQYSLIFFGALRRPRCATPCGGGSRRSSTWWLRV